MIAGVVFFFVVKPVNVIMSRAQKEPPPDPSTRKCPYCFSTIPSQATRCAHCTSEVEPLTADGLVLTA
jgi:large conductance mechanosensitive channel